MVSIFKIILFPPHPAGLHLFVQRKFKQNKIKKSSNNPLLPKINLSKMSMKANFCLALNKNALNKNAFNYHMWRQF